MSISSYQLEERDVAEFLLINGDNRLTPQYRYTCRICGWRTLWHRKDPEPSPTVTAALLAHAERHYWHPLTPA